jgi:hypothetical protein
MGDVARPNWWCYPLACEYGLQWTPGRVIVSWMPCDCALVSVGEPPQFGHLTVSCQEPGCRSNWYKPPHDPATMTEFSYPSRSTSA